jgi:protein-tyrosine phosphatase
LVYRSDQPNPVTPEDLLRLGELGLRTVFDLRTEEEAAECPDQVPEGVEVVWLDVFGDIDRSRPVILGALLEQPEKANAVLGGGKVDALLERAYRAFISLPSARRAYRELFEGLARPARLPALFHCMTGKDRTGWAAAALLSLLGVPRDAIFADYLLSNGCALLRYRAAIDAFVAAGGEASITEAVFGVKPAYLEAAFDEVVKRHGTLEAYFEEGLGIGRREQQQLAQLLLDTAGRT